MSGLTIGARLIAAREHSKLTLEKISEQTNMPLKKLESLENDEVKAEDFTAFDKAFLKKYCQFIGVVYDDLFSDLKVKSIKLDKLNNQYVKPSKKIRRKKSFNLFPLLVGTAVLLFGYFIVQYFSVQTPEESASNHLILDSAYNQNV